ncbi:MAG: hypothetical protein ACK5M0_03530 [Bacteroidales bacterium]
MRSLTTRNVLEKKHYYKIKFQSQVLGEVVGEANRKGCWLIYGKEKQGKTSLALQLVRDMIKTERVSYISAEEGLDDAFILAMKRAGIKVSDKANWNEYLSIEDIVEKFKKHKSPDVIFIDNLTIYNDELKQENIKKALLDKLPNKLFILLAHEERKEPYPASARLAAKLAKVIFHVVGLKASVTSRFSQGGEIEVDENKCEIIWGDTNK